MTSAPSTTSSSSSQRGARNFTGEMAAELLALVDSGTIRVIDMSLLPLVADAAGIAFDALVARILDLAVARAAA